MKMMFRSIALLAALWTTAASAQDFTGPSIGVQAAWSSASVRNPTTDLGTATIDESKDAFVGGVFVGYDQQVLPSVVIGVQADLNFGASDKIVRSSAASAVTLDPKRDIDLTARAGYLVTPDTLLYVRGGYTNTRVETTLRSGSAIRTSSEDRDGWLVGGGVERILWDRVSARLEYRYSDLSDGDGKFDRHQVLFGVAYRF